MSDLDNMPNQGISSAPRHRALGVLGAALLLPVFLALTVFPTPMYDTRELIAWGREFPIVTPFHPPMMVWVGGLIDRLFGTSAAVMILAGQILISIGLLYFYRTLLLATPRDNALLFTFLYGMSSYTVFAPLSFALNADILQLTSWPAIIFHFLQATKSDRLRHWIAFGTWSAIAMLTKYNVVVLFFAMASAILLLPALRTVLRRPGFYAAIAIGATLILPHAVAALRHNAAFTYGLDHFDFQNPLSQKIKGVVELVIGYLMFAIPGYPMIAIGVWKGYLTIRKPQRDDADISRVLLVTAIAAHIAIILLVMTAGLNFLARFAAPYIMLTFLAVAPLVQWKDQCSRWFDAKVVPFIGGLYLIASIVTVTAFTAFTSHSVMQEPTAEAARLMMKDWHSRFSCGPAYFIGGRQRVYGVGIEAGHDVTTLAYREITAAAWYDEAKLRTAGAIVIDTDPEFKERMLKFLPGKIYSDEKNVTLPLRRTWTGKWISFPYHFIAPEGCPRRPEHPT